MKPRVGIAVARAGIPSEIWIDRQIGAFRDIEPVLLCWESERELPVETHRFKTPFHRKPSLVKGVAKRLGLGYGATPTRAQADDIRQTVEAAKLDAVYCHFAWAGLAISSAVKGLPVVWQVHARDVTVKLREAAYRNALAKQLPGVAHLIAVANYQIDALRPLGLGAHSVIPCGAPLAQFASRPIPVRDSSEPLRFVTVGRLSPEKGMVETLQAFRLAVLHGVQATLSIYGGGDQEMQLARLIDDYGLGGSVALMGHQPAEKVAEAVAASHVFILHSRSIHGWQEGFSVAATEAGAAGLPLLMSRVGGNTDQVEDGVNGFLFNDGDVETQAELMVQFGNEPLRRPMGEASRASALRYDTADMARHVEAVILNQLSH